MNTDFYGLPTHTLQNAHLRLEYLAEAGPRIVRLFPAGSDENLFAELPKFSLPTPYGEYFFRGGHRLWHSPEAMPRTYIPDNAGLLEEPLPNGVRLSQPAEIGTGIAKQIEIHLSPDRAEVVLHHYLRNEGLWPVELAAWAITQFRLGGTVILPQPVGPVDAAGLLPNRQLVLWPYTRWGDERLILKDDVIHIHAQAQLPPVKVGYRNPLGWLAYRLDSVLFIKRFELLPDQPYPDHGCNAEVYCNDQFVELESLGPLVRLGPGQAVQHNEAWELRQETI